MHSQNSKNFLFACIHKIQKTFINNSTKFFLSVFFLGRLFLCTYNSSTEQWQKTKVSPQHCRNFAALETHIDFIITSTISLKILSKRAKNEICKNFQLQPLFLRALYTRTLKIFRFFHIYAFFSFCK